MQSNPVVQASYYPFTSGSGTVAACKTITDAKAPFASTVAKPATPYVRVDSNNDAIQSAIMVKPVSVGVEAS